MKKVIFVSGTAYSGSTFFHMILANDPHGLAVGEAQNYMRPVRPYHFDMRCSCGEHPCQVWKALKAGGEENLYPTLFEMFPEIDFIVDSSKNAFWIADQKAYLQRWGIQTQDVVIWKTPYELAQSFAKRGLRAAWEQDWVSYHRMYYTLFGDWSAIPYQDLANDRQALTAACSHLAIDDFPGKERYWESGLHHVVGGNPSARVHLYEVDNANFKQDVRHSSSKIEVAEQGTHRSIYYEQNADPAVWQNVQTAMEKNPQIPAIYDLLQQRDLRRPPDLAQIDTGVVQFNVLEVQLRRVKYNLTRQTASLRYG